MNNNLKISLVASLNTGLSIGEINNAIRGIEKKVSALKLNIQVNDNVLSTLKNFSKEMSKLSEIAKNTGKVIEESINPDGSRVKRTYFNGLKGEFSEVSRAAKESSKQQLSSLSEVSSGWDKVTKEVEKYNAAQQKIGGTTSLSNTQGTIKRTVNTNNDGNVVGYRDTYDYAKEEKLAQQATKDEQALIDQMESFRLQSLQRRAQREREFETAQQQAIQRNSEIERQEIAKTQQARQSYENWWQQAMATRDQRTRASEQKTIDSLATYKRQAEIQATGLLNNKNKILSSDQVTALNNYLSSVRGLNAQTPQLSQRMQQLGLDFKQISANAQQVSHHAMSLGDSFKTAISKMGIWLGAGAVFFQSLAFIKEGVTYVNELNKSLTEISIVTGQSQQQVNALGDSYNKLAGSMGVTTNEIAQTAAGLYRQGLSADEASKRMRTVIQYAKISALDINTASEIMTAAINSMGVSGQKAADVWSYLGDATATGADEIGKAMQKVGGSAGALNLPFEQVSSWIAVISSRTRESAETIGQSVNICADLKESEIAGNP